MKLCLGHHLYRARRYLAVDGDNGLLVLECYHCGREEVAGVAPEYSTFRVIDLESEHLRLQVQAFGT